MTNRNNCYLLLNCWVFPPCAVFFFLFIFFLNQWDLLASADFSEVFTILVVLDFLRSVIKWRMYALPSLNIMIFQVNTECFNIMIFQVNTRVFTSISLFLKTEYKMHFLFLFFLIAFSTTLPLFTLLNRCESLGVRGRGISELDSVRSSELCVLQ